MDVSARLKNVRLGARKGRAVAGLIRRKNVADALVILQGNDRKASRLIEKLLKSAVANAHEKNARQQAGIDLDNLYVKTITVDQGPYMWRIRPRAMGRASWIGKQTSHVSITLAER
jgi:large subunit ribosomal protein L22